MSSSLTKKILVSLSTFTIIAGSIFVPTATAAAGDIVDKATTSPQFSTLVTAVQTAGLVTTLQGAGPFTVLAPTNEAFAKLPADVLAKLLLPENKASLTKILTYHVLSSKVEASEILKLTTAKTVQGSNIKIATVEGKVKLNDSTTVITTDIQATNGVIHGIDSVLIPADLDISKLSSGMMATSSTSTSSSSTNTTIEDTKSNTIRSGGKSNVYVGIFATSVLALTFLLVSVNLFSPKKK
jgi:uncharacterized surface protein with fasciclin (FAS1) repeats